MKKHLFALASAVLLAPAASALEGDAAAPATPLLSSQAVATDAPGTAVVGDGVGHAVGDGSGQIVGGLGCDSCRRCFWIYGEYLNWKVKGDETPVLLSGTTLNNGAATTQTFGGDLNENHRRGFRAGIGVYPHCRRKNLGIEANWFSLGDRNEDATFVSSAGTTISRPFNAAATGLAGNLVVGGGTTGFAGQATVNHQSLFYGGNLGLRSRLTGDGCSGGCGGGGIDFGGTSCTRCVELLYGYQYYQLNETLRISTSRAATAVGAASTFANEEFDNANMYHGGYLGLAAEYTCGKVFFGGNGRVGVGYIQETSRIRGSTATTIGGGTATVPVGTLLALPSNIGTRIEDEITWSGELGGRIGIQPVRWLRGYLGYSLIYIDQVFRPGGAVNNNVNLAQLNNFGSLPVAPLYLPRRDSFWAHGLSAGVELKF